MPSSSGSPEPRDEFTADMVREAMAKLREQHYSPERRNAPELPGNAHSVQISLSALKAHVQQELEKMGAVSEVCPICRQPFPCQRHGDR